MKTQNRVDVLEAKVDRLEKELKYQIEKERTPKWFNVSMLIFFILMGFAPYFFFDFLVATVVAIFSWMIAWTVVLRTAFDEMGCIHGIFEPHTKSCMKGWYKYWEDE